MFFYRDKENYRTMRDILVVEDGLHERERLAKLFEEADFTVDTAESAKEAEQLLNIEKFRLAVLDVGLGDKSGSYLFELIKRTGTATYVIILTGNPSVHLKQRFLDEGAAAYIVKASADAENEAILSTVQGLLGVSQGVKKLSGINLNDFVKQYLTDSSKELFLDQVNDFPACSNCGNKSYVVTFTHKTQLPPLVEGMVVCDSCQSQMDPEIG